MLKQYPATLELHVYKYDNPTVLIDILPRRTSLSILEELKNSGGGSFTIQVDDPKLVATPSLMDYRNLFKVVLGDTVLGAFVLHHKQRTYADSSEGSALVYEVSGEGLRSWFRDAALYPFGGLKKNSADTRTFSFASPQGVWYNAANWVTPYNVADYGPAANNPWRYAPAEWPDVPNAKWIWSQNSISGAPAGDNYFRLEFNAPSDAKYSIFLAADDYFEVYLDGALVSSSEYGTAAWTETFRVDQQLSAGSHTLAVRVNNIGGAAGLIAAVAYFGNPLIPSASTLVSYTGDANWKVSGYPTNIPGWTIGEILLTLLSEAQARSVRFPTWITPTFTAVNDSAGNPWARGLIWTFDTGMSYYDILVRMEEVGADFHIDPATLQFHAWKERGTDRSIQNTSVEPVILEVGKNLVQASEEGTADIKNRLTVKTSDGWVEKSDIATSIGLYGVVEGSYTTNSDAPFTEEVATAVFKQKALPEEGASYDIISVTDAAPYENFFVGDWVLAPGSGALVRRRVVSLSVTETDAALPVFSVEFDTVFQDSAVKMQQWLDNLASKSLGGAVANSLNSPPSTATTAPTTPTVTRYPVGPTGLSGSSYGVWNTDGAATSFASLTWNAVTLNTDGSAASTDSYEVWGRKSGGVAADSKFLTTATTNAAEIGGFDPAATHIFKVRARSNKGVLGDFSSEFTLAMVPPLTPLPTPDAPTISSKLGVIKVAWNGLLAGGAPPKQFSHVYTTYATSEFGTYTTVGQQLSRSGTITVSGLNRDTIYWFKLYAVDRLGVASTPTAAVSVVNNGVTGPDISANSITANEISVGTLEAMILQLGQRNPLGETNQRVPTPLTDESWWDLVLASTINLVTPPAGFPQVNATPTATGISLQPTGTEARHYLTSRLPLPQSKAIFTKYLATGVPAVTTNLIKHPSAELLASPLLGTNRATNPSVETNTTNWGNLPGTTGVVSASAPTTGGQSGLSFYRATWTTASTAVGGGITYSTTAAVSGETLIASIYVRSSKVQRVVMKMEFMASNGTTVLQTNLSSEFVTAVSTWQRLNVSGTAPAATVTVRISVVSVTGVNSSNWLINDTLDADALLIETGSALNAYYDGSLLPNAVLHETYKWSGTAHASTSTRTYTVSTNLVKNPSIEAATSTTPDQPAVNLLTNPSFETDLVGWTAVGGTTIARGTTRAYSGTYSLEVTRTAAGDDYATFLTIPVSGAGVYNFTAWVYITAAGATFSSRGLFAIGRSTSNAPINVSYNTSLLNQWQRVIGSITLVAGDTSLDLRAYAMTGAVVYVDAVQVTKTGTNLNYFDGSVVEDGYDIAWTGTAHASTSQRIPQAQIRNLATNPGAEVSAANMVAGNVTLTRSTAWFSSGAASFLMASPTAADSYVSLEGDTGAIRLGMVAGMTYTVSATARLDAPLSGTLVSGSRERRITAWTNTPGGSYVTTLGTQFANVAGTTRVSVTFTVPANATEAFIRLYMGHSTGSMYWDDIVVVAGADTLAGVDGTATGTYFDGSTVAGDGTTYAWAGTSGLSAAVRTLARPNLWQYSAGTGGLATQFRTIVNPHTGSFAGRVWWRRANTAGDAGFSYTTETGVVVAGVGFSLSGLVRSSKAQVGYAVIRWLNSSGAVISSSVGTATTLTANTWTELRASGTAPAGAVAALVGFYCNTTVGSGLVMVAGDALDLDAVLFKAGLDFTTYFDGASTGSGDFTYSWIGTANASYALKAADILLGFSSDGPSIWRSGQRAFAGSYSLALEDTANSLALVGETVTGLTIGQTYNLSAWGYADADGPDWSVSWDGGTNGTLITQKEEFTRSSMTFVATATSHKVGVKPRTTAAGTVWFDGFQLSAGSSLFDYSDGDNLISEWTGTAHDSTSTFEISGIKIVSWDAVGVPTVIGPLPNSVTWEFPASTVEWAAFIDQQNSGGNRVVADAQIFEVIGSTGVTGLQSATLSPQGLRLVSDDGTGVVDLTTSSDNFLSIQKFNGLAYVPVATIDSAGVGLFSTIISNNDVSILGTKLVGTFADAKVNGGQPVQALFDRLGRGIVSRGTAGNEGSWTTSATSQSLANFSTTVEAGRQIRVGLDLWLALKWTTATHTTSLKLETWVGSSPQDTAAPNGVKREWEVLSNSTAQDIFISTYDHLSAPIIGLSGKVYVLLRILNAGGHTYNMYVTGSDVVVGAQVYLEDIGPDSTYADLGNVSSRANSGAPPAPPTPTTMYVGSVWHQTWGSSGIYGSSSSRDADGRTLQQGGSGTNKVALFGFPALGLSGKTILSMRVRLQNRHTYNNSGASVLFGAGGYASPPGGGKPGRSNGWDDYTGKGEQKWYNIPSSLWASFASGALRNLSLGQPSGGSGGNYAIFDSDSGANYAVGAGAVNPTLEITYV